MHIHVHVHVHVHEYIKLQTATCTCTCNVLPHTVLDVMNEVTYMYTYRLLGCLGGFVVRSTSVVKAGDCMFESIQGSLTFFPWKGLS